MDSLTSRFQQNVFSPYLDLLKAKYRFHPTFDYAKNIWGQKLTEKELVKGPYLEKSQIYKAGKKLDGLNLHERTKQTIAKRLKGGNLWKHQTDALELILKDANAVVATGTSSGKTLCYQIPILDDLIRNPGPGLRAIIIYPLNALVNDQLEEWERMLGEHPQITFARFTGQTPNTELDYRRILKETYQEELTGKGLSQQEIQQQVEQRWLEREAADKRIPNRLNDRGQIRSAPPNVLITNFSMLEYLLERPVDAPIFEKARLKFLVLDEAHAYRGIQATEIAFLIRRLKERLGLVKLTCIATSATLGKQGDAESEQKVRSYASNLFGEPFEVPNPVYGTPAELIRRDSTFSPEPNQYLKAVEEIRKDPTADIRNHLDAQAFSKDLPMLLAHDDNLYRLRTQILSTKPTSLKHAADELWENHLNAEQALEALLEIVAVAKSDQTHEDILPTRLHYFVRAQDGFHVCLHKKCPGRKDNKPTFFVSRKTEEEIPEGFCPECARIGHQSRLVEVVTCRKCGYLYGALQDLGPRRAQTPDSENSSPKPSFDSFSTELGWMGDSYWSYFSVETDLPYPISSALDADEDDMEDSEKCPSELDWCVVCGKKKDEGAGDNCTCEHPHLRRISIFHRQCPHQGKAGDYQNLYKQEKTLLPSCPNCGARNGSGIEPVQRFQESDDEMGLAMAIPLAHFQVSSTPSNGPLPRKLLCFTDHRQRAAAFPSLLEEETFSHDMGRKILAILDKENKPISFIDLGELLADEEENDSDFFLPTSRFPDEEIDAKGKRNLWIAETFGYFGVPDSARESVEDFGLAGVEYKFTDTERKSLHDLFEGLNFSPQECENVAQVLLGYMRQRKAFTLPKTRVQNNALAFGRITADISYVLRRKNIKNTNGWLPKENTKLDTIVTDYLKRLLKDHKIDVLSFAEKIWNFLIKNALLIEHKEQWKLGYERLYVKRVLPNARYVCNRCRRVTMYSTKGCCPSKRCQGTLELQPLDLGRASIIERWVAGDKTLQFSTLKSEEHTAQINKNIAKQIEDKFRNDGVNLLSSTTTFEMGINIGDLQKILLRNAPPSSANYVQRVGRAGRGKEKNSVCVTLCRRTKYDADIWKNPLRIMSGEVRAPTVFIQNRVIAQRHFNALVFAKFLRMKLVNEQGLGELKQQIRLEGFLSNESRKGIPDGWLQLRPTNLFLDFCGWLISQKEKEIATTASGQQLLSAVLGFEDGLKRAESDYKQVIDDTSLELVALSAERKKIFDKGGQVSDIEQAIKNMLKSDVIAVLAKRGFLPRYAFPLDVVPLETGRTRWSGDMDVELNRDRGIAIAEFAPGAQVIAHKKVFTSKGLYIVSKMERPEQEWYSECPSCKQIRTNRIKSELSKPCEVCKKQLTSQHIRPFVEPSAFSVRVDDKEASTYYRRSTLIRQRQSLTHFIDQVEDSTLRSNGLFQLAIKEPGSLFRYNLGPENKGFMLCPDCGCSEPLRGHKAGKKHQRLRPFASETICSNDHPWTALAYGHKFQSCCLIIRPSASFGSIESLAYALQRALCLTLDIEPYDVGVSWRRLGGKGSEIILYDHTPGGAGFVKDGYNSWAAVAQKAYDICATCTCEAACYDCLKNYSNQSYHEKLDRQSVASFFSTNASSPEKIRA